ncbi:Scn11a [Symbiodinium sp. CCMP2592]|nr:Scn11a [Symbiodinium sp. CCMP2592]
MDDGYSDGSRSSSQYGPGFYAPDDPRATRDKVSSSSLTQAPPMKMGSFVKVEAAPKDAHIGKGSRCFRTMMYLNRAWIPNIVAGVIVFDLIVTCIDIDERAAGRAVPPALNTVMIVCIVVYTMEFALNTWLLKLKFLRELTTWLDAFVLICGWVELIIYQMGREDLYIFRDIRMLRVVRICRLANLVRKTRSLRELRKMITMFSTCARTLAWSLLFCFGMMTMWAMLLVELVNPLCCLTDAACTQCSKATGSIMEANLLLFKTVIAGDSWGTIAVPIIEAAPLTAIIFCGSLLTLVFGVLNLVVVVVVDTFAETRDRDMMNLAEELEFTHEDDKKQLLKMFERIEREDEDEDGVTLSELIQGVRKDRELQSRLRVMDIDEVDLEQLFYMIDADGSGTVEAEEFVTPLSRWVHDSKTATRFIKYNLMRHMQQQEAFMQDVSSRLDRLQEYVAPAMRISQRWEEIPPPTGIPRTSMRTSLRWELIPPPPPSRRSQTAGTAALVTSPALVASEGEVESPKSSALDWLEQVDVERPTDKIVNSTRLAEEDALKTALVDAEKLLVASNKELLEKSLKAMKGVFHGVVKETGSPSSAKKPRSMSAEHSDAPTKQKPMAYSALSEKSEFSKTDNPEAPAATAEENVFLRTVPGSGDPDRMHPDESAAQISVSVVPKRGTRDICGI